MRLPAYVLVFMRARKRRRQFARSAYSGISFRPLSPRAADSHQRYIPLRVYSLLSQLDATLFAKQRTLSNKKILRTQRELAAYRNNCSTTEIIFHLHYIMNYFCSCPPRLSPLVTKDINDLYLLDKCIRKIIYKIFFCLIKFTFKTF